MAATLLLDTLTSDLVLDANLNIAVATEPYSLGQDAASAIKTFKGEVYWDVTVGIPYMTEILGKRPPLALLKAQFVAAAKTVPGVISARCFIAAADGRIITGQVQVSNAAGQTSAANFSTTPQGA